jgi:hypothetical protein
MPKYRNTRTGVVVDIPESLAASIGTYKPVDAPEAKGTTETPEKPARRRTRKSD